MFLKSLLFISLGRFVDKGTTTITPAFKSNCALNFDFVIVSISIPLARNFFAFSQNSSKSILPPPLIF